MSSSLADIRTANITWACAHVRISLLIICFFRSSFGVPSGQERVGGNKLVYRAHLTRRGQAIYTRYLGENVPLPNAPSSGSSGLADISQAAAA